MEKEEIVALESLELDPDKFAFHARNMWLFSFYFAGMRASDVLLLRWSDFEGGRLHYIMQKNKKVVSLKVPQKAEAILDLYRPLRAGDDDLVFPPLKNVEDFTDTLNLQKKIKYRISRINDALKIVATQIGLTKPLTMHIARHSFGNISGDKIPVQKLQQLYRHSSILTTIGYQKAFMYKSADDALDAVLDF